MKAFAFLLLAAFAAAAIGAEMYRWVDDKGVVNYTPYPPPANIKKVETKRMSGNTAAAPAAVGSYSLQQAVKNFPVTLFANDCGELCNNARAHLKKRGIPYTEKNPNSPNELEELKKASGGGAEIPLLVVGSLKTIKGYFSTEWDATLDQAGYPSTAEPGAKPPAAAPAPEKK
jgi:hypothetical protein